MKPKIMIVGEMPPPTGGIQTCIEQILSSNMTHDFEFIPINTTRSEFFNKNKLLKLLFFLCNCIQIVFIAIKRKPTIAHFHVSYRNGFWRSSIFSKITKLFKIKNIFHAHGSQFKLFYSESSDTSKIKIKKTLSDLDYLIVLSESWKIYYSEITRTKIFILKNAVERINHAKYCRTHTKRFNVLFLGSICSRKGVYDLIESISKITKENIDFTFVGPFENKAQFIKEILRLGIENKCNIIGEVLGEKRFKFFASANCFILPSYNEGLPIALLEAMSFGLPIISTKVGAIPEVIKKENGILFDAGDIDAMTKAIVKIASDKDLARKMSNANKLLIESEYNPITYAKNLKNVYLELSLPDRNAPNQQNTIKKDF